MVDSTAMAFLYHTHLITDFQHIKHKHPNTYNYIAQPNACIVIFL